MRKLILFMILILFSPEWVSAQDQAYSYLEPIAKKYGELKDYSVDVNVHFDIETFKSPDLQGKLYYKTPDKMKVESKRVFFFPKEGAYFNPSQFKTEEFEIKLLERITDGDTKRVRLRLTPKKTKKDLQHLDMMIDVGRNLVEQVDITQLGGRLITATLQYGRFNHLDLPVQIKLHFDIPNIESPGIRQFEPSLREPKRITGRIELTYSNYKVNSGLRDEIFKEEDSYVSRQMK